jgi:hypothetical protein
MLIVKFREHFRDRQMEWALAAGATGWGALLVGNPDAFGRAFYAPLARMAPSSVWGWGLLALGAIGLVVLFINGAWRRTPMFRQISSTGRMFAWSGLLFGCFSVDWQPPSAALYAMILVMEVMALSNATADGQRYAARAAAGGR